FAAPVCHDVVGLVSGGGLDDGVCAGPVGCHVVLGGLVAPLPAVACAEFVDGEPGSAGFIRHLGEVELQDAVGVRGDGGWPVAALLDRTPPGGNGRARQGWVP